MKCLKPERQARVPGLTRGRWALASISSSCPTVLCDSWGTEHGCAREGPGPPSTTWHPEEEEGARLAPLASLVGGQAPGGQSWREESRPDARSTPAVTSTVTGKR